MASNIAFITDIASKYATEVLHDSIVNIVMAAEGGKEQQHAAVKLQAIQRGNYGIETRNYHMIGIYVMIKCCIRVPYNVFSMMIAGLILDTCAYVLEMRVNASKHLSSCRGDALLLPI